MVVIKANITPGDELQTRRSWKVIAGSSQPPPRKTTIFFYQKGRRLGLGLGIGIDIESFPPTAQLFEIFASPSPPYPSDKKK